MKKLFPALVALFLLLSAVYAASPLGGGSIAVNLDPLILDYGSGFSDAFVDVSGFGSNTNAVIVAKIVEGASGRGAQNTTVYTSGINPLPDRFPFINELGEENLVQGNYSVVVEVYENAVGGQLLGTKRAGFTVLSAPASVSIPETNFLLLPLLLAAVLFVLHRRP